MAELSQAVLLQAASLADSAPSLQVRFLSAPRVLILAKEQQLPRRTFYSVDGRDTRQGQCTAHFKPLLCGILTTHLPKQVTWPSLSLGVGKYTLSLWGETKKLHDTGIDVGRSE